MLYICFAHVIKLLANKDIQICNSITERAREVPKNAYWIEAYKPEWWPRTVTFRPPVSGSKKIPQLDLKIIWDVIPDELKADAKESIRTHAQNVRLIIMIIMLHRVFSNTVIVTNFPEFSWIYH